MALAACNAQTETPVKPVAAIPISATTATECVDEPGLSYICGFQAPEDLLTMGTTGLLLASGQRRPPAITTGHMYVIDPVTRTHTELVHTASFVQQQNTSLFPDCPGPLNLEAFAVHGMSIAETAAGIFNIYTVSHGEREAIEVYDLDLHGAAPALTWRGCVVLPQDAYFNGVVRLADGGFLATRMRDANQSPGAVAPGAITGSVFEWHPGGVASSVAGTGLSLPNGIDISHRTRQHPLGTQRQAADCGRQLCCT